MAKQSNQKYQNIFKIIFNAFMLYVRNILPLTKVMLFPVLGQVLGIVLILYPTYLFSQHITSIFPPPLSAGNLFLMFLFLISIILPGFFIFIKAFWEFMVAMATLNLIIINFKKKGVFQEPEVTTRVFKLRTREYVFFLLLITLIWLIGLGFPFIAILFKGILSLTSIQSLGIFLLLEFLSLFVLIIVSVYLSLGFQVFALENLSAASSLKKSWNIVEGNFWKTFLLALLSCIITGTLIPAPFQSLLSANSILPFLTKPFIPYMSIVLNGLNTLHQLNENDLLFKILNNVYKYGNPEYELSKIVAVSFVGIIITALLLPLSTAFYSLLYFDIKRVKGKASGKKGKS